MSKHNLRLPLALLLLTVVPLIASEAEALHGQTASRPTPITVVLVDELPALRERYDAVVLRRSTAEPRDVILLPRATANGELLDAATRALLRARATQGEHPSEYRGRPFQTLTIGVSFSEPPVAWRERYLLLAEQVVEQLRSAPPRQVPGVGTGPALAFYPPSPGS